MPEYKKTPKFLLAHSMGGLVQLKTILSGDQSTFQFQILSSPMLGVAVKVPAYKDVAAQILYNLLPQVTMGNEIQNEFLTRDSDVIAEYLRDTLRHNKISSGVYLGSLKSMEYVFNHIDKLKIPTFIQMAEQDPVVSSEKIKQLFDSMNGSIHQLKAYPNRRHELYNDIDREEVFQDLRNFIQERLKK